MPDQRRRMGFAEPFTPEQYDRLRAIFVRIAKKGVGNGETFFEEHWPELQRRAIYCRQQLAIMRDQSANTVGRHSNPNEFRHLRVLSKSKQPKLSLFLKRYPDEAFALLYGAMKAGLPISGYVESKLGEPLSLEGAKALLLQLSPNQTSDAARAALAQDSILRAGLGRLEEWPLLAYIRYLAEVYHDIRGTKLTSSYHDDSGNVDDPLKSRRAGPPIDFVKAALAFDDKKRSSHTLRNLIDRAVIGQPRQRRRTARD